MKLKQLKERFMPASKTIEDNGKPQIELPEPELNFTLRPADIHDITILSLLWSKMTSEIFDKFIKQGKMDIGKFAFAMADRLRLSHVFTQVACDGVRVIGFIHGYLQERPYGQPNKVAFCECLYVMPEYRGKGLKKRLVDSFINWAEVNGLAIEFMTRYDQDLMKVWERSGFTPYSIIFRR